MSYQSWSVVFGEQPSAAKWNILGTNDASFNDGTGIGTSAITTTKLNNASVTADKLSTGAATQSVATSQTRTSSTAGDLATAGPSVSVTIGANGLAFVAMAVDMLNSTTDYSIVYLTISGANTVAATQYLLSQGTNEHQFGTSFLLTGLTAGSTTFKMQYSNFNNSSTATFKNRVISVIPL